MSRLLADKQDDKLAEIKISVEKFLSEISKADRRLFSYQEIEDILLDIYNLNDNNNIYLEKLA